MKRGKKMEISLASNGDLRLKGCYLLMVILLSFTNVLFAQNNTSSKNVSEEKAAYVKMITERAEKITAFLDINDAARKEKVTHIIRDQYSNLNDIYAERDSKLKALKEENADNKAAFESAKIKEEAKVNAKLAKLHKKYLAKLSGQLSAEQIDQVKNGMTYGVLPLTYKAYQEQILTLTEEQKKQILIWLTEAREHAMDAESSNKKHAWFGKYKGRINNYLSAAGYDLKKEGKDWELRRKAAAKEN
ncbi:DUF3826 domain-containing protein [Pedobacter sp. ASV1-7]|uniref:DUF3826 domain-containing protein n=1 Tax=Pedobacter sp. ASV1-7 TaxID=3145237 RepID=UPI0032E8F3D5